MTPREARNGPVAEALLLLPAKMTSPQAELMLLAIGQRQALEDQVCAGDLGVVWPDESM